MTKEEILINGKMDKRLLTYAPESLNHIYCSMDAFSRQQSIAFSEWVDEQGYQCILHTDENVKIWQKENGKSSTTDELYTLFLQSKTNLNK